MLNSKIVGAIAVVAVLASVGVGYAVTSSPVYMDINASAAGVSIAWVESGTGAPSTFASGLSGDCVATFYSTKIIITASDMDFAGVCAIYDTSQTGNSLNITNTGGFPVSLNDTVSCSPTCTASSTNVPYSWITAGAGGCWDYADANTVGAAVLPATLSPGGVYPGSATYDSLGLYGWFAEIGLEQTGTDCAGTSFSVTVTFTGTSA
jgi:hypothetical protein